MFSGQGALQDIDQMSLFKSVCKWQSSVKAVRDIAPTLRKAIQVLNARSSVSAPIPGLTSVLNVCTILRQVARSGTPGPVFVELPIDTLYPSSMVEKEISNSGGKKTKPSLLQRATQIYLQRLLKTGYRWPCDDEMWVFSGSGNLQLFGIASLHLHLLDKFNSLKSKID